MTHGCVLRGLSTVLVSAAALIGLISLPGCSGLPVIAGANISGDNTLLTAEEASALIENREGQADFVILDVRTPEEFADGHIEGAINLCLTCASPAFADAVGALDQNTTYVVYCRSGNRSATATAIVRARGLTDLYELSGGTIAWQAAGLALVK